ncbi:PAS domain S-box-containing protein/diguanylate cyclase (GGDEF) domain-containing protein [Nitrosospira briensis]|uniref:PAS domain S-box-containing protein/diguanylate cyclase (GGDEF) domain-containing protein n=1 Tax=Nitrosospira briensis TaxID=35799 RepID=A0A1I5CPP3_9PROT|nr:EAL domain-containing protein [Nitrosospira briensis]SFN88928.1 PAS domain S-box-containing protein/diguanylate cyclase (GGDEF) domain-containing protein [Nitrosospira briensis]
MKVLYLEDNALDADLVRIEMEKRAPDIQLDVVGTLTEALARVDRYHEIYGTSLETPAIGQVGLEIPRYDLVLTDLNLPDGSGETLLALVRGRHLPLPVVILTGSSCEDMVLALLRAGADDYVIKRDGFLETLALVLRAALDKFHTETYRRAASLRILYVEPNADDIDLTKQALASIAPHLKIESLRSAEQVFHGFAMREAKDAFDVLLLDYRLPGVPATDILKELCQVRGLDLPIILVAGQDDEEIARQSLKLGAADYVVKSAGYLQRLPTVIENVWLRAESARRERTLLEERTRLSLATEAAAIGIWEWNTATNEVIWDDRMYEIYGAPRGSTITYEVWKSYTHPDDLPEQEAQLEKITAEDGRKQLDFRILRGPGCVRHLHIAKAVKWGQNGSELRIVGTAIDITKRKETELAIQEHAMQQSLIAAFGQKALASADLDELWDEVAGVASHGLNVDFCKVLQLAPDLRSFILKAGSGWQKGWIGRQTSFTYENSQNRFVLASHQPVIVNDFRWETRFKPSSILRSHGIRSSANVLISGAGGAYGILGAYSRDAKRFTSGSINFLQSLANILATAIDRKTTEERLTYLAQFDPLTELPNRSLFLDRLRQAMEQAQRSRGRVGVVFADLDRFKIVNDTMGHSTGDKLLVLVAQRLQQCVRSGDTVARLGGDEFAFILSNLARAEDATIVAEKVIAALSLLFELDGQEIYTSVSLGISIYPGDGTDADSLLRNADTAMFQAKEQGRAIYQFYLPQMNERAVARLKIETQLRGALARREFVLHYQPKASLTSGEITGFEALLRWQHPAHGLVPPLKFISVLEDTGLIVSVGEWVVRTVCDQLNKWQSQGLVLHPVSVNLSARQFQQQDLDSVIGKTLEMTAIDPHFLEFELTESVLMKEAEAAANALQNLKAFGVKISMDDFGTGYSSLAYLKRFPLDTLKIDRAFIRDVTTDLDDAAIAVAMIKLAHSLGLKVVAEGVETRAQLDFLIENGCDEMQGYYFSQPLPLERASQALIQGYRLPMGIQTMND